MTIRFTRERGVGGVERGQERSPREVEKRDTMAAYSKHSWGGEYSSVGAFCLPKLDSATQLSSWILLLRV